MPETILVIGGCRSGKSRHALDLARYLSNRNKFFFATCVPYDEEMKQRVTKHQEERASGWKTIETPYYLPEAIDEHSSHAGVILVDCLTLWTTNLIMETEESEEPDHHIEKLITSINTAKSPVIFVSNEVGAGIVPENLLARRFRDLAGMINQKVAAAVDKVVWMVAGIPVTIKGK